MNGLRLAQFKLAVKALKWTVVAAVLVGAFVLTGECVEWLREQRKDTAPSPAMESERVGSWERVEVGGGYVALRPPEKERKRLEREFGVRLSAESGKRADNTTTDVVPATQREVLAVRELPPMTTGGRVLVTSPSQPGGEVEVTIRANRAKFIEFTGVYGLGGMAGLDQDGKRWKAYGLYEPLRVGRFHARVEAGAEGRHSGASAYILAGVELRSK